MADACILCKRPLRRRKHVLSEHFRQSRPDFVEHIVQDIKPSQEVPFDGSQMICYACWHKLDTKVKKMKRSASPPPVLASVGDSIVVPELVRAANTARRCVMNKCANTNLRSIPNSTRTHLLSYCQFYIPKLARICQVHFSTPIDEFKEKANHQHSDFNGESLIDIVEMYTHALENRE